MLSGKPPQVTFGQIAIQFVERAKVLFGESEAVRRGPFPLWRQRR